MHASDIVVAQEGCQGIINCSKPQPTLVYVAITLIALIISVCRGPRGHVLKTASAIATRHALQPTLPR